MPEHKPVDQIMRDCVVFGGRTHPDLVKRICQTLAIEPTKVDTKNFSNGETSVKIHESVRDKDVFVVQTAVDNVNDALMELLIIVSALKISSAKSVTTVLPLFPYSRQLDASAAQTKAKALAERQAAKNSEVKSSENVAVEESSAFQRIPLPDASALFPTKPAFPPSDSPASSPIGAIKNSRSLSPHAHFQIRNELGQIMAASPRKATFGEEPRTRSNSSVSSTNTTDPSTEVSPCLRLVNNVSGSSAAIPGSQLSKPKIGFGGYHSVADPGLPVTTSTAWVSQNGSLVASLLATAGADHVITMDLHDPQYQGFFDIPFDNLLFRPLLLEYIQALIPNYHSAVIVSPDAGGAQRATAIADQLHNRFALIHQDRRNNATILVGDVNDRVAILIDDLLDSGSTLLRAGRILKDHGAVKVYAICTHGLFSDDTVYKFKDSAIDQIVVTNSVPQNRNQDILGDKLHVVDISMLFAEAIRRVYNGESFSRLYTQAPMAL